MVEEKREKYWSRFQNSYDKNQAYVVGQDLLDQVNAEIRGLPALGEVLELGCGTGCFSEMLAQKARRVIATDLSDELLQMSQKRLNGNTKIVFQKEDCMALSCPSEQFNSVFMANLIHVIEDPLKTLQECYRVLEKKGLLILTTFTSHGMKPWELIKMGFRFSKAWGKPPRFTRRFSPDSLALLIESAGFSIQTSRLIGNQTKSVFVIAKKNP